jgi:hypothetical protein
MIFFKTKNEYDEFPTLDNRIKMVLFVFAGLAWMEKNFNVIVTDCLRTKQDDQALGITGPDPHIDGRAVDVNFCDDNWGRIFDDEYAARLAEIMNKTIPYGIATYPTVFYHDQGLGKHFHLQVNPHYETKILK